MSRLIQQFLFDIWNLLRYARPIIICILIFSCSEKKVELEVQEKLPETSTVLISGLKVRMGPDLVSSEIGRLSENVSVKILAKSSQSTRIGRNNSFWYQVETEDGLKGWVYGAYLSLAEGATDMKKEEQEKLEAKLKKHITGRWYAVKKSGSLKTLFVTLFEDGKFEAGFRRKIRSEGEYGLVLKDKKLLVVFNEIKKPLVTQITGELIGATFVLRGIYKKRNYKFKITEKKPKSFKEEKTE